MTRVWQLLTGSFFFSAADARTGDRDSIAPPIPIERLVRDETFRTMERHGVRRDTISVQVFPVAKNVKEQEAAEECHVFVGVKEWSDELSGLVPGLRDLLQRRLFGQHISVRGVYWRTNREHRESSGKGA